MAPYVFFFFFSIKTERPSPPSKPTIGRISARTIELVWTPEFDGNSPIEQYYISYKTADKGWDTKITIKTPGSSRRYILDKLKPATNYHVRLYANNAVGTSNPGVKADAKTKEDGKSATIMKPL